MLSDHLNVCICMYEGLYAGFVFLDLLFFAWQPTSTYFNDCWPWLPLMRDVRSGGTDGRWCTVADEWQSGRMLMDFSCVVWSLIHLSNTRSAISWPWQWRLKDLYHSPPPRGHHRACGHSAGSTVCLISSWLLSSRSSCSLSAYIYAFTTVL